MLSNKDFMHQNLEPRYVFLSCDVCDKSHNHILFDRKKCRFSSSKCDPHIVYMSSGVYCLCSEECLKKFAIDNFSLFNSEVEKAIVEDNYFFKSNFEDLNTDVMEEDISAQDGVETDGIQSQD